MSFLKDLKEDITQSVSELTEAGFMKSDDGTELKLEPADEPKPEWVSGEKWDDREPEGNLEAASDSTVRMEDVPAVQVQNELSVTEEAVSGDVPEQPEPLMEIEETVAELEVNKEDVMMDEEFMGEVNVANAANAAGTLDMVDMVGSVPDTADAVPDMTGPVGDSGGEITVITQGTTINGSIKSDTSLDVRGVIEGDVECEGKLTITGRVTGNLVAQEVYANTQRLQGDINSKGVVKIDVGTVVLGNISSSSVVVAGAVKGNLDVNGPVIVDSTAAIKGDIASKSLQVNSGAVIDGHYSLQYADVDLDSFFE